MARRRVIDALAGIQQLVFEQKVVSLADLLQALADNWQGHENLRQQFLACAPKYANDQPAADEIGRQLRPIFRSAPATTPNATLSCSSLARWAPSRGTVPSG